MAKKKKYIPKARHNPEVHARKLEKNRSGINRINKTVEALTASHDIHISYLGNFARHDIKNSIQSMDSILSTTSAEEITEENILSLKANLKIIRETMDNFSKLIPYSKDERFTLKNLIIAVELLTRNDLYKNKIKLTKELPKEIDIFLNLPFQSILQMFNNLVINAIKALENSETPNIKIFAYVNEDYLIIELSDNGMKINEKDVEKIFDFGYSTTDGSGIGLYHAKYLCELFNGKIEVRFEKNDYCKTFLVHLPIIK